MTTPEPQPSYEFNTNLTPLDSLFLMIYLTAFLTTKLNHG